MRTRYAPSPTGYLTIGGAWMAFFNWLFARSQGGRFVLRIEDTDRSRSSVEYEQAIFEDFRWLGLDWDEGPDRGGPYGPYRQTERMALYRRYAAELLARGAAYPCYCTPEELDAERARAKAENRPYRYSGRCRDLTPEQRARLEREGRRPTIRLRLADYGETIVVDDLVRGRVEFDPANLDDYIIVRSDGSPLYNFANVVDDHTMAITHVIRGVEHLSNTPKQWVMYRALGWAPPQVAHLPNILGADRKKLSKRTGDTAVRDYRRRGYLPAALLNFFALMAWYPEEDREIYSVEELVARFRIQDLGKASPVFDMEKLTWMNGVYMRALLHQDPTRVVDACLPALRAAGLVDGAPTEERAAYIRKVVEVLGDRLKVGQDIVVYGDFFFKDRVEYEPEAARRYLSDPGVAPILQALRERVAAAPALEVAEAEAILRSLAAERGLPARAVVHPTRVALTGKTAGPGLFELMALLGKDRVVRRLDDAVAFLRRSAEGQGSGVIGL
ncbi:MAG: glutamate--tRNA ligase [Armatimonadota bacterium]|nr:glutamate--tRNA ligase [Armatimonadota bacterium]MDR7451297.1 glutamate--tRNA ligase [Armatimonadota bacterium]MDR7466800.1 glutamate--tRNA ligase [Armatimonadota bacterium]MDR7492727.1 glutamate--tRNA ligase [Armatimonadota bacterium]MDR7498503.1 glutamate--tRNA ligase [Armatimonadota bacterium]